MCVSMHVCMVSCVRASVTPPALLINQTQQPSCVHRQMILTGCVAFARHVGPTRVEAELLPQCWEQVSRFRLHGDRDFPEHKPGALKNSDPVWQTSIIQSQQVLHISQYGCPLYSNDRLHWKNATTAIPANQNELILFGCWFFYRSCSCKDRSESDPKISFVTVVVVTVVVWNDF